MPRSIRSRRPLLTAVVLAATLATLPTLAVQGRDADPRPVGRPDALVVVPETIKLGDLRDARQLVVTGLFANDAISDLTHLATIAADTPGIVSIESGYLTPKGDGRASLVVRFEGREARVPVEVAGLDRPSPVSFRREVVAA